MAQSTIAIIILISALVLYAIPKMPLSVTTLLAMIAMVASGILDFATATSGFANRVIFLIASLMIIGQAMVTTGLAQRMGGLITRVNFGKNEKLFMMIVLCVATIMSVFMNGSITVAILMPIVDAVVLKTDGAVSKKQTYFPVGVGAVLGNNILTISATSMLTAVSLLADMGYGTMSVFAPVAINLPAVLAVIVFYGIIGYKLQAKWFDFEEPPVMADTSSAAQAEDQPVWKQIVVAVVFIAVVVVMVAGVMDYGLASLIGATIVMLTGCISEKTAMKSVGWSTVIVVAGAIGFSNGIKASGAGEVIANFFINVSGPLGKSGIGICIVLFFVSSLISSVMSDNASVAIMLPIGAAISESMGISAVPMFLAICSGVKVALGTPVCVTPMTQVQVAGYRFKDYFRMGGLINLISMVVTCTAIALIYY